MRGKNSALTGVGYGWQNHVPERRLCKDREAMGDDTDNMFMN